MATLDEFRKKYSTPPSKVGGTTQKKSSTTTLDDLKKKYHRETPTDEERISSFMNDAISYLQSAQGEYEGLTAENAGTVIQSRRQNGESLRNRSKLVAIYNAYVV